MIQNPKHQVSQIMQNEIKRIKRAKISALNRAGKSAIAQTVQFIRQSYNIKSNELKNEIKISLATASSERFKLQVTHKAIELIKFSARQTRKGVSAVTKKGERKVYSGAFITTVGKGHHTGIFTRVGKARLPIKQLYGPSAMQLVGSKQAREFIEKVFYERLEIELKRAIEYVR